MKVIKKDIWEVDDGFIAVTTNGILDSKGNAVMGRGIALQAKKKLPDLPRKLGAMIRKHGNNVYIFAEDLLVTVPTKEHWKDASTLERIERSCREIFLLWQRDYYKNFKLYLPKLGTENGKLNWSEVEPIMDKYLRTDNFIVVEK